MTTFDISIHPSIGEYPTHPLPASVAALDWGRIVGKIPDYYLVEYIVRGQVFFTGPTDIVSVFVDVFNEMQLFEVRKDHTMMMGGYSVLSVEFYDDCGSISQPDTGGAWKVVGPERAFQAQEKFRRLTQKLWNYISFKIGG